MKSIFTLVFTLMVGLAAMQAGSPNPKSLQAYKMPETPKIDGDLTDPCWQHAPMVTDFITYQPSFGNPSGYRTECRIGYDNQAIYIGAYMYDSEPDKILRQFTARDDIGNAGDYFAIAFDTYHDKLNAFRFEISAAGVQGDARTGLNTSDYNWDAVWTSKVAMHNDGWSVEIRMPYSALRFPKKDIQEWGIQFARNVQRTSEFSTWSPIDPNISGIINQYGVLENLENIQPPLRLSFMPYVSGYYEHDPEGNNLWSFNGGMDVKYGINEAFTLDMTLIPDFGQVQFDNIRYNLGPFELRYEERRPFFTEGSELFNKADLFYSRRIGGTPEGYDNISLGENEFVSENPAKTQLYNATKLSGRTKKGLGIGVLNAVTRPSFATIENALTGETRDAQTGWMRNYNVAVLDQSLRNNSSITFTNMSMLSLAGKRSANVSDLRFRLRDKANKWELQGAGGGSYIWNNETGMQEAGFRGGWSAGRVSGKWLYSIEGDYADNKYNPNDVSLLNFNNYVNHEVNVGYYDYVPKGIVNNWSASASLESNYRMKPYAYANYNVNASVSMTTRQFYTYEVSFSSMPRWYYDFYEPRIPGRKFYHAPWAYVNLSASTDYRRKWVVDGWFGWGESPLADDAYIEGGTTVNARITNRLKFRYHLMVSRDNRNYGYVNNYDEHDIFLGRRYIDVVNNELGLSFTLSPRITSSLFARHYWFRAFYDNFYYLNTDGSLSLTNNYPGNHDFNYDIFTLDFVFQWEFTPGSRLIINWKNSAEFYGGTRHEDWAANMRNTFNSPDDNILSVKFAYYIDYQNVKHLFDKKS